jgi:hypothetical protein
MHLIKFLINSFFKNKYEAGSQTIFLHFVNFEFELNLFISTINLNFKFVWENKKILIEFLDLKNYSIFNSNSATLDFSWNNRISTPYH